ncbi:hypothetical protein CQA89_28785, partial [Klebsiella pneumoniae]
MGKLRLTTAQALVKFLDNQYLEVDGVELKFVKGIFAIFGHGNVLGLGQALEQDSGKLRLTTAQALVKFLDNQYLEVDGVELKFVKGI